MSNEILHDRELKLIDRGLLITIIGLDDGWDFSVKGLASIVPEGREAIQNSVNRLKAMGYLVCYQEQHNSGKFGHNIVEVCVPKNPQTLENQGLQPWTGFPYTVKPDTDKPYTENPHQYNTKEYKKQEYKSKSILSDHQSNDNNLIDDTRHLQDVNDMDTHSSDCTDESDTEETYTQIYKLQVGYNKMTEEGVNMPLVDALISIMVDVTLSSDDDTYQISGKKKSKQNVMDRLGKLNEEHVKYVVQSLENATNDIKKKDSYMLAALYNAPTTYPLWVANQKRRATPQQNKIHDFDERPDNDWDKVELAMLQRPTRAHNFKERPDNDWDELELALLNKEPLKDSS